MVKVSRSGLLKSITCLSNLGRLAGYQSSCPTSVSLRDSFSMNPLRCNNVAFPSFFSAFTLDEACDWCSLVM